MAQEDCGALIGTDHSKMKLVRKVRGDVSGGNAEVMKEQIKMGKKQLKQADYISPEGWFNRFRKEKK
jgi:hypothetical protein